MLKWVRRVRPFPLLLGKLAILCLLPNQIRILQFRLLLLHQNIPRAARGFQSARIAVLPVVVELGTQRERAILKPAFPGVAQLNRLRDVRAMRFLLRGQGGRLLTVVQHPLHGLLRVRA